jgi:hypothetical protein
MFTRCLKCFFFVFSCQNMIKNEFLLIWNRPTWFPMIRCCWNLGNASEELSTSFQRIKGSFFFKKKKTQARGLLLVLPSSRDWALVAIPFFFLLIVFFQSNHLIFGWLLIGQRNLFWYNFFPITLMFCWFLFYLCLF